MGIDNVLVEINGSEVPAMDGSSAPFTFLLEYAGIETQNAPRKMLEVLKPVTVQQGDKCAVLAPSKNGFALDIEIDFAHAAIRRQRYALAVTPKNFKEHVAPARTFGFVQDVEMLQKMGLARGADLTNAVALQGDTILNEEGLRFQNEFARHKTLDALGDLYTSGFQIRGRYRGMRPGHHINNCVLQALFADATNYRFVTMTEADLNIETSLPESSVARAEKKALQRMAV
jgi:UDP-3-O-[3-hydroxymyristoyl] N-acetylglucosamine deacetylase